MNLKQLLSATVLLVLLLTASCFAETDVYSYSTSEQAERLMRYNRFWLPDEEAQEKYCGTWYASEMLYMDVLPADIWFASVPDILTFLPDGSALYESECELGLVEGITSIPFIWGSYPGGIWMRPSDEFLAFYAEQEYLPNEDEPYLTQMKNIVDLFRLELKNGKLTLKSPVQAVSTIFTREKPEAVRFYDGYEETEPLITDDVSDFDGHWYPYRIELYSYPINMKALPYVPALEITVENGTVNCEALRLKDAVFVLYGVVNNLGTVLEYENPAPIDSFSVFADTIEPEDGFFLHVRGKKLILDCDRFLILYCTRVSAS